MTSLQFDECIWSSSWPLTGRDPEPGMETQCAICARRRSSCSRNSGVNSSPKPSASNTWRISSCDSPCSNGLGQRLAHSMASSSDLHCHSQKPATSSLVSGDGPSGTVRLSPRKVTRAPFALVCRPSPASITPALTRSSLNLPIAANSFSLGIAPASDCCVDLTITMKRMSILLLDELAGAGLRRFAALCGPSSNTTSRQAENRQLLEKFFYRMTPCAVAPSLRSSASVQKRTPDDDDARSGQHADALDSQVPCRWRSGWLRLLGLDRFYTPDGSSVLSVGGKRTADGRTAFLRTPLLGWVPDRSACGQLVSAQHSRRRVVREPRTEPGEHL